MTLHKPASRPVLGVVSDSKLNISNNNNSTSTASGEDFFASKSFLKHNAHSTPIRNKTHDANPMKRSASEALKGFDEDATNANVRRDALSDSDADDSPKLKRARLLKMKLKLAYFKVRTNQTDTPLHQLKFPSPLTDTEPQGPSISASIFHSKKVPKKRQASCSASSSVSSLAAASAHRTAIKGGQKKSIMDDVVTKKGAFANLKRFNREYHSNNGSSSNHDSASMQYNTVPSSAPPGILTFNHHFHFSHLNNGTAPSFVSSVTSPSKFAISAVDKKQVRLPPVPRLPGYPASNIFHISRNSLLDSQNNNGNTNSDTNQNTIGNQNSIATATTSTSTVHDFHDTTIEEKLEIEKEGNDTTILQNESTSTPLLRRRHSIDQMERNDPDLTILQSNNSVLMSTPVRQNGKQVKKPKPAAQAKAKAQTAPATGTNTTTNINTNSTTDFTTPSSKKRLPSLGESRNQKNENTNNSLKHNNSILKDEDETQLMSSPTRLLSTPSSIGAAKCLLQLAHR